MLIQKLLGEILPCPEFLEETMIRQIKTWVPGKASIIFGLTLTQTTLTNPDTD